MNKTIVAAIGIIALAGCASQQAMEDIAGACQSKGMNRHSSIAMTQRYIEVSEDACRRVVG